MMILINGEAPAESPHCKRPLIVEQAKKEEMMAEAAGKSMRGGARKNGSAPSAVRCYFATMIAWDEECRERIRKHRKMREKEFYDRRVPCGPLKAEVLPGAGVC